MADNGEQAAAGDAGNSAPTNEYIKLKVVGQVITFLLFWCFSWLFYSRNVYSSWFEICCLGFQRGALSSKIWYEYG